MGGGSPGRRDDPVVPDDVDARELAREVRSELSSLPRDAAEDVARRLVLTGRLLSEDPELAYRHALVAKRRAGRLAVVREAVGVAAHRAGHWSEALGELRTYARMTGSTTHLPLLADCQRALGRPERALELAGRPDVGQLDVGGRMEMRIVAAGARRDLGQPDAAVLTLQTRELHAPAGPEWVARLRYAYADALLAVGRRDEARVWFGRAAEADPDGITDAVERCDELDGIHFVESDDVESDDVESDDVESDDVESGDVADEGVGTVGVSGSESGSGHETSTTAAPPAVTSGMPATDGESAAASLPPAPVDVNVETDS